MLDLLVQNWRVCVPFNLVNLFKWNLLLMQVKYHLLLEVPSVGDVFFINTFH